MMAAMGNMAIEVKVWIEAAPEGVFDFIANVENNPRWQRGMREAHWTSAMPIGVGSTYSQVASFLGKRIESRFEIVEYEPGRRIKGRTTASTFPITFTRSVEPEGAGTRVTALVEGNPSGLAGLGEPVMKRVMRRTIRQDYANLKQLIEGGVPG